MFYKLKQFLIKKCVSINSIEVILSLFVNNCKQIICNFWTILWNLEIEKLLSYLKQINSCGQFYSIYYNRSDQINEMK